MKAPEPRIVWLVREGNPEAIEGTLAIEGSSLTFAASDPDFEKLEVPLSEIAKVRRLRASPILELTLAGRDTKLFLYFAKPPPLPVGRARGLRRSAAALSMRASSKLLKKEIDEWVEVLRARA